MSTSPTSALPPETWRFGRFALDAAGRTLQEEGQPVALGTRAFDLLAALVARAGDLVTKRELLSLVWPGLVVEENNLQVQVSTLRKLLGASALATIPGRGYRFDLPVVRGDATPVAAPSREEASAAPRPWPTNLPGRLPPLYGRAGDIAAVQALLDRHAMVTIVGAGGIGKTRVGQAVAMAAASKDPGDYADGVWWVELAPLTDEALVPATVAHALGAKLTPDRPPSDALWSLLASQSMLLVLDNCEHLCDAVASLVETLRAHAPRVSVLVTSQETLKVSEEHVYRVGPLAVPDAGTADAAHCGAVELFVARAQAADPNFTLTAANAAGVGEICRRLDGIPLAIEFAAARVPLLGVEGLRARLDERFNLLTGGSRVVLRRHQTLRATLEWSHALLTPDEQTVFRRLAVFAGGFTLEAAQHVAHDDRIDPWTALDHLGALVDKSLVLAEGDPVPRYRLLETTRAYALERLAEAGETESMLRRHAEATLAILSRFDATGGYWLAAGDSAWPASAELDNVRAAMAWAEATPQGSDIIVPLAATSFCVWWATMRFAEGLERCLALSHRVDERVAKRDAAQFFRTVARLGTYSLRRETYDAAVRAAAMFRELGDDRRLYDALTSAAAQGVRFASVEEVEAALAEAARIERPEWPPRQRASLEFARCWMRARQGRTEEALACAHRQVAISREGNVEVGAMFAMSNVTAMELMLGRVEAALEHARESIARLDALRARAGAGHLHRNAAMALAFMGRMDEALDMARIAYALLLAEGDEYLVLPTLALIAASQGRLEDAARVAGFHAAAQARLVRVPEPLAACVRTRFMPLLAKLPPAGLARLSAEGAALHAEDAFRIGFGAA